MPNVGNIFQYESSGRFNQQQLIVSLNNRFSRLFSIFANYALNRAKSDTDGSDSFPANQYDLSSEYGRSIQDVRHRLTLFGSINALPWGIRLSPFIVYNSSRPFNITLGRDINGDTLFTERPAFADAQTTAEDLRQTLFGNFDINPKPGQTIIPRNYGTGSSFFTTNLRISKTLAFGGETADKETHNRYNVALSASIQNLFNTTNEGTPVENINSPFFGQSFSSAGNFGRVGNQPAGNRRVDLQMRFSF
jgi:hypothetical protein